MKPCGGKSKRILSGEGSVEVVDVEAKVVVVVANIVVVVVAAKVLVVVVDVLVVAARVLVGMIEVVGIVVCCGTDVVAIKCIVDVVV